MKQYIVLIVLVVASVSLRAQSDFKPIADEKAFYAQLSEKSRGLHSLTCDFTQKKHMSMLADDVVSKGLFYFAKPAKLRMEYTKPIDYLMVINGEKMKIVSEGKTNITDAKSNKMMQKMKGMIAASMTGDLQAMASDYHLTVSENAKQYHIAIVPKDKAVQAYIKAMAIYMDKGDFTVARMRMEEPSGDYTEYSFTNKKKNEKIEESVFSVQR